MNPSTVQSLHHTTVRIFEELGFLMTTETIDEMQRQTELNAAVRIDFKGPCDGTLLMRTYGICLPELTENMLGESHPTESGLHDDALGELANVVCGNILPSLTDENEVFNLMAPVVTREDQLTPELPLVHDVCVGLENGRAELSVHLDSRHPVTR